MAVSSSPRLRINRKYGSASTTGGRMRWATKKKAKSPLFFIQAKR